MNTKRNIDDTESEDLSTHGGRRPGWRINCEGAMHTPGTYRRDTATRPGLSGRAVAALALVASMLVALVGATPAAPAPALGDTLTRVVVEARADLGAVSHAVAEQRGRVLEVLSPFPLVVAEVPAAEVDDLEADPATGSVTPDTTLHVQSLAGAPAGAAAVASAGRPATDSDAGKGVGVVVVDTGIADHPDLAGRVIARFAPEGSVPDDLHGHGTFMAGLVAGDGEDVDGIAPGGQPRLGQGGRRRGNDDPEHPPRGPGHRRQGPRRAGRARDPAGDVRRTAGRAGPGHGRPRDAVGAGLHGRGRLGQPG